jgi:hypothetical protein
VVQYYLWRWQIELFFRWLKSHLALDRPLGFSANAVQLSVWLALILHLLALLAARVLGLAHRSPSSSPGSASSSLASPADLLDPDPSPTNFASRPANLIGQHRLQPAPAPRRAEARHYHLSVSNPEAAGCGGWPCGAAGL